MFDNLYNCPKSHASNKSYVLLGLSFSRLTLESSKNYVDLDSKKRGGAWGVLGFIVPDTPDSSAEAFPDSDWDQVGLPHSF